MEFLVGVLIKGGVNEELLYKRIKIIKSINKINIDDNTLYYYFNYLFII